MLALALPAVADSRVSLVARATPGYTLAKYTDGKLPKAETYVFMQGSFFEGQTVDHSIERTPFRRIAEFLAPELARQQYFPTREIAKADLVIVVHWGTTVPYVGTQEMTGRTSPASDANNNGNILAHDVRMAVAEGDPSTTADDDVITKALLTLGDTQAGELNNDRLEQLTDSIASQMHQGDNVKLLGYADDLHRLKKTMWTTEAEQSLRYDLVHERYFIILKAYDLREKPELASYRRPAWTMNLNISSPGNNFPGALNRMSVAGVNFFGRTTDGVTTVKTSDRQGTVTIGPLVIIGEESSAKPKPAPDKKTK